MPYIKTVTKNSIEKLKSEIFDKDVIANELLQTLKIIFSDCSISIYLTNPQTKKVEATISNKDLWPIPFNEIKQLNFS